MPARSKKIFTWAKEVPLSCRAIALDWHSRSLRDGSLEEVLRDVERTKGVYAFEGCHDANAGGAILYIGESGSATNATVDARLADSLRKVWRECEDGVWRLHSDVWNVTIRWAAIENEALIRPVESLLIVAHSPAFNNQQARTWAAEEHRDLLVLNAGRKGRLIPVVLGAYLNDSFWPDSTAR